MRDEDDYGDRSSPYDDDSRFDDQRGSSRAIKRAKDGIRGPAIGLMVCSVLSILWGAYWIFAAVNPEFDKGWNQSIEQQEKQQKTEAEKAEFRKTMNDIQKPTKTGLVICGVVCVLVGLLSVLSCFMLLGLKGRGLGYFVAILNVLTITTCCCVPTSAMGLWLIIALGNSNVKDGFAAVARNRD